MQLSSCFRSFLLCALFLWSVIGFAATGRITDAQTGGPIAGATVYVVWYEHPFDFGLVRHSDPSLACNSPAVATTDANGEYDLGLAERLLTHTPAAEIAVVAPGYYDPWKSRGGSDVGRAEQFAKSLVWGEGDAPAGTSRALRQFGNVSIDTKLIAVFNTLRSDPCLRGVPVAAKQQFEQATYAVMNKAMCVKSGQTPSADVVRRVFMNISSSASWSLFVSHLISKDDDNPLVSKEDDSPISELALDNICSIEGWARGPTDAIAAKPNDNLVMRIKIRRADSDQAVGKMPVRILWGAVKNPGTRFDRDHALTSPVRSIVTASTADGTVDLPVTGDMLREQQFDPHAQTGFLNYLTEIFADDQVAFSARSDPGRICDLEALIDRTSRVQGNLRIIKPCADIRGESRRIMESPHYGAGQGAAQNEHASGIMNQTVSTTAPALMPGQANASMASLQAAASAEDERRARKKGIHLPDFVNVYTYHWDWPSTALLKRTYELLFAKPAVEQNPEAFVALERSEFTKSFSVFCGTQEPLEDRQDYEIIRMLWWADSQVVGVESANQIAQRRGNDWDNGMRCNYRDGQMISIGGTRPPNILKRETICSAWRGISKRFTKGPLTSPPTFSDFTIDYSKRDQACVEQPRMGSSL